MEIIDLITGVIGLLVGGLIGFLIGRSNKSVDHNEELDQLKAERDRLLSDKEKLLAEKGELQGRIDKSVEVYSEMKAKSGELESKYSEAERRAVKLEAEKASLERQLIEQKSEIEKLNDRFKKEFENLANQILKQNTRELTDTGRKQIEEVLRPFKERIEQFEKRVNEVYRDESQNRSKLLGQVQELMKLNQQISDEANNLTRALKGESQTQGAWGEMILENILEFSGLEKGVEYNTQVSSRTSDGLYRPDVEVYLPDNKLIIIDSKVSLKAYEKYVNAEAPEEKARYLKQHIDSIRTHVKSLSEKDYSSKASRLSLDFVLMFIPLEAGFAEALKNDSDLFGYAWEKRIVIVSPTTLLATMRTIASVWKQEKQNRNVQEIARLAGAMVDKLSGFMEEMKRIDTGLDQARKAYDAAYNKLYDGRGNVIGTAKRVIDLGAKATKKLPE